MAEPSRKREWKDVITPLMSLVFLGSVKKMLLLESLFLGKGEGRLSFEFAFMVGDVRLLSTKVTLNSS